MSETENGKYEDILALTWGNIPEPKTLPDGSWELKPRNASYQPGGEGKDGRVVFFYTPVEPMEDVNLGDLKALEGYDVSDSDVSATFWIEKKKDWDAVRTHLSLHGVDVSDDTPLPVSLKAFRKGNNVVGYVTTRSFVASTGQTITQNVANQFAAQS